MAFGKFGASAATAASTAAAPAGPAPGGFKRTAAAAAAPAARPAAKKRSRFAGVKAEEARDPILGAGRYRVRVLECEQRLNPGNGNETFHASLEVLEAAPGAADAAGDRRAMLQMLSGKGGPSGLARSKAFVMGASGYESSEEAEYDAFDPDGEFVDSVVGAANAYADAGATVIGRLVDVEVTRGNDVVRDGAATGDYYRNFAWSPVPEDEQDTTPAPATRMGET